MPPKKRCVEHLAEPVRLADALLGMPFAQVLGHRRRFGVADAIHDEPHLAAEASNLEHRDAFDRAARLLA